MSKLGDWLHERTLWREWTDEFFDSQAPSGGLWLRALAAAVATTIAVLALTGVVLMTAYSPSPQGAWASVHYVQFVQQHGWIIRGLHYWAAQALLVLAALHILFGALGASYRPPREIAWWLTLAVLGLALGECITGGLLPWDQRGWWARVVESNIVGLAPKIGGFLARMISGGTDLGALGLARAFTAHVFLLPLALVAALAVRRSMTGRFGWVEPPESADWQPQLPAIARSAVVGAVVVCALFAVTGWSHGAPLEAPADPMSDYPARPEWYLMTLFRLRKFFHGSMEFWGTTLIPGAAAGYLVILPWLDRGRITRALAALPVLGIFGGAVWLGVSAHRHDAADPQYAKSNAKWEAQAAAAAKLAMNGVPPDGALAMERRDPEMRGQAVFEAHCAGCHVLGNVGDPKKATATKLDGWTTVTWIEAMIHDPDAPEFFGRGPYKEQMPSVDVRPKNKPPGEKWIPMVKSSEEKHAVALFLSAQGNEPDDPPQAGPPPKAADIALGEKVVSERCTTCHLYKGDGDDEGSGLAPELGHYGSLAWTRAQIANPSSTDVYREKALDAAMKKHMPRFDKDLSPSDIEIVARYVRRHARSGGP